MQLFASDFADAWARFLALDALRLQQETLEWEWSRGRTDYVAFLFAIGDENARRHIARVIEQIDGIPGVEPYPESYWHITVKGVGFMQDEATRPDEVSRLAVQALADVARPILESTPAFDITIGPASGFAEVVILEVHDGGVIRDLNKRLIEALPSLQRYPIDGDVFLPHVSIARYASNDGLRELKERLAEMRADRPFVKLRLREVILVQARLAADQAPAFDLLALYPLAD